MPEISKIVITGGPCGGKSTAMNNTLISAWTGYPHFRPISIIMMMTKYVFIREFQMVIMFISKKRKKEK